MPNPVYLQVGDTQQNLMKRLGRALRDNKRPDGTPHPITLVFALNGSCTNIAAIYGGVPLKGNLFYIPSIAEDVPGTPWKPTDPPLTCAVSDNPADPGVAVDIANSALFNSACRDDGPPPTVKITQGPVQAYVLAVPTASTQTAITFEEAYFVFGFGAAGMIAPWIDEAQLWVRKVTKSTLLAWARNLSIPEDKFKGQKLEASADVINGLNLGNPAAIGILGAEVYDGNRSTMKSLAYRAKGQYAAYYPDSSSSARDKQNVRDGHYTVWSPTIWMDRITEATGAPVKADARYVIDLIAGKTVTPAPSFSMIDVISAVGLVPDCAMRVNRTVEGGPLTLYRPSESCTCKYESLVAPTAPACAACSATLACATGVCRNGLCEDH
ncbi:MAG: hypothetical protein H7138_22765 [Myxococcales bacterium]|nr:hypothetical protein [Myxococcales bacterium]